MNKVSNSGKKTSWHRVGKWYHKRVGQEGHYYHKQVILPGLDKLLSFEGWEKPRILDAACGQGILGRHLPLSIDYEGVDAAPSLIGEARKSSPKRSFRIGDLTKPLPFPKGYFSHCACVLALQNIEKGDLAIRHMAEALQAGGQLVLVLNHPTFRIPRQSHWGSDEGQKLQYRRVDRYMSALNIPIQAHPGQGSQSESTWSFHHPLSTYFTWLRQAGFVVEDLQEWCSDKESMGRAARMENKARQEFPLFMAISARKLPDSDQ